MSLISAQEFVQTLSTPVSINKEGHIMTIRKLDKPCPPHLWPSKIHEWYEKWIKGEITKDNTPIQTFITIKKRLRQYHAIEPSNYGLCKHKTPAEYAREWRQKRPGYSAMTH